MSRAPRRRAERACTGGPHSTQPGNLGRRAARLSCITEFPERKRARRAPLRSPLLSLAPNITVPSPPLNDILDWTRDWSGKKNGYLISRGRRFDRRDGRGGLFSEVPACVGRDSFELRDLTFIHLWAMDGYQSLISITSRISGLQNVAAGVENALN